MKRLLTLWHVVAKELATRCHVSGGVERDFETLCARSKSEGESFLTISLPAFNDDLLKGLRELGVGPDSFSGFRKRGGTPVFLGGFLDNVFDRKTGELLDDPDPESIFAIRQLTLMFGKIALPCSKARVAKAYERFHLVERELKDVEERLYNCLNPQLGDFRRISDIIWGDLLSDLDRDVRQGEIVPRHGPGATADRLTGNRKYDLSYWPSRLEDVFPYLEYALPSFPRYWEEMQERVEFADPGDEIPVRVIDVPKTLKTPRIIAIEPTAMQYMQQGLMARFVKRLEEDPRAFVGILDQGPNQALAKEGSQYGAFATLDLSDASDRVLNLLVREMMRNHPSLDEAVQATRSTSADVLGSVIQLRKFASMGSALTFPIEAMIFTVLVFLGIERANSHVREPVWNRHARYSTLESWRLRRSNVQPFHGQVRVYGDDIIVPTHNARSVIETLESFGLKVNQDKSFLSGSFRESCGKDYFAGDDVSVTRVRREFPRSRTDVKELVSLVALRNQFYMAGMWQTTRWLDDQVREFLPHYPTVAPTSSALGRWSLLGYQTDRIHPHTHSPLVRAYVQKDIPPRSIASGIGALVKFLLKQGEEPFFDEEHLERQGRPVAVDIKLRWTRPF